MCEPARTSPLPTRCSFSGTTASSPRKQWPATSSASPIKAKQLGKALSDLAEEGVAQVFRRMIGGDYIVGVVGQLQLEVLQARILKEYNVPIAFENINFEMARWVRSAEKAELDRFISAQKL